MAWNNNNGNGLPFIGINLGMTFSDTKAYQMTILRNCQVQVKFFTPTISGTDTQQKRSWDMQQGGKAFTISHRDTYRLYLAAKELVKIYTAVKSGKIDLTKPENKVYTTKQIRIPLVAKPMNNVYGAMTIGIVPDPKYPNEETFAFGIEAVRKDGTKESDSYVFSRTNTVDGLFEYSNGNEKIHESQNCHMEYADFILQLESIVKNGRLLIGHLAFGRSSKSGGGSPGGYNGSGGGNSGGYSSGGYSGGAGSSGGDGYEETVPF